MWKRLSVALVLSVGCTIGDPSSTAVDAASGGKGGKPSGGSGKGGVAEGGKGGAAPAVGGAGEGGGSAGTSNGSAGRDAGGGRGAAGGEPGAAGDDAAGAGAGASAGNPSGVGGADTAGASGADGEGGEHSGGESGVAGASNDTGVYAGVWSGVTSQGGVISFTFDGAGLVELEYDWVLPLCASTTHVTTPSRPPIEDGQLRYYAAGDPSADFVIDFDSTTTAHGTFELVLKNPGPPMPVPVCRGTATVTFSVTKSEP